jgi:hypothetical protein
VCSSAEQAAVGRRAAMGLGVSLAASLLTGPRDAAYARDKGGVYWLSPADGATVQSPFKVKMGVKGLDVVPAAQGPVEGSGHHHILYAPPPSRSRVLYCLWCGGLWRPRRATCSRVPARLFVQGG